MIAECINQHRKIPFNNPIWNEDQRCDYNYLIYLILEHSFWANKMIYTRLFTFLGKKTNFLNTHFQTV